MDVVDVHKGFESVKVDPSTVTPLEELEAFNGTLKSKVAASALTWRVKESAAAEPIINAKGGVEFMISAIIYNFSVTGSRCQQNSWPLW